MLLKRVSSESDQSPLFSRVPAEFSYGVSASHETPMPCMKQEADERTLPPVSSVLISVETGIAPSPACEAAVPESVDASSDSGV